MIEDGDPWQQQAEDQAAYEYEQIQRDWMDLQDQIIASREA